MGVFEDHLGIGIDDLRIEVRTYPAVPWNMGELIINGEIVDKKKFKIYRDVSLIGAYDGKAIEVIIVEKM